MRGLEETRKNVFRGERGPRRLIANLRYFAAFCDVFWRFEAFSGVFRRFSAFSSKLATTVSTFCGILRHFTAFCGVLRSFVAFCGVLRHLRCIGDKFPLRDQIFGGGSNPRPLFWSVEKNRAKMGGRWPCFPPENIFLVSSWRSGIRKILRLREFRSFLLGYCYANLGESPDA